MKPLVLSDAPPKNLPDDLPCEVQIVWTRTDAIKTEEIASQDFVLVHGIEVLSDVLRDLAWEMDCIPGIYYEIAPSPGAKKIKLFYQPKRARVEDAVRWFCYEIEYADRLRAC